jgi:hypothetical protein
MPTLAHMAATLSSTSSGAPVALALARAPPHMALAQSPMALTQPLPMALTQSRTGLEHAHTQPLPMALTPGADGEAKRAPSTAPPPAGQPAVATFQLSLTELEEDDRLQEEDDRAPSPSARSE